MLNTVSLPPLTAARRAQDVRSILKPLCKAGNGEGDPIIYLTEDLLARWIIEVIYAFGSAGGAVLAVTSNLLSLIPSQPVLPLTGYQVSQGCFAFSLVLVAATVGSVVRALTLYALG